MRTSVVVLGTLTLAIVIACGGQPFDPQSVDLTGTWQFQATLQAADTVAHELMACVYTGQLEMTSHAEATDPSVEYLAQTSDSFDYSCSNGQTGKALLEYNSVFLVARPTPDSVTFRNQPGDPLLRGRIEGPNRMSGLGSLYVPSPPWTATR